MFMSVDLPDPERAHDRDHLAGGHGEIDAAEGEHLVRAHGVDLFHARDLNHRLRIHLLTPVRSRQDGARRPASETDWRQART